MLIFGLSVNFVWLRSAYLRVFGAARFGPVPPFLCALMGSGFIARSMCTRCRSRLILCVYWMSCVVVIADASSWNHYVCHL